MLWVSCRNVIGGPNIGVVLVWHDILIHQNLVDRYMQTLTLKIPQNLVEALNSASASRRISKSAMVRDALERILKDELKHSRPAVAWLERWRGTMQAPLAVGGEGTNAKDLRVAHILSKHLR